MKTIPQYQAGGEWNNDLLNDLSFIKRHLRYPFSKKTLPALLASVILLSFIVRLATIFLFARSHVPPIVKWTAIPLIIFILFSGFYNYYRTLKFIGIPTTFFLNDNMQLVASFLQSQQLAVYRHPDAPEVFQILSRPFSLNPNSRREVMIFIADDKRILVNSHYVNQKFTISPPSPNARIMARKLRGWLKENHPGGKAGAYMPPARRIQ